MTIHDFGLAFAIFMTVLFGLASSNSLQLSFKFHRGFLKQRIIYGFISAICLFGLGMSSLLTFVAFKQMDPNCKQTYYTITCKNGNR